MAKLQHKRYFLLYFHATQSRTKTGEQGVRRETTTRRERERAGAIAAAAAATGAGTIRIIELMPWV